MIRWTAAIATAAQLAATFYVNRFIEPKLKGVLDPLPVISPPLITLVLSGLIVVLITTFTVERPRLVFRWSAPFERNAFQPEITLNPSASTSVDLQVELLGGSLMTRWLRKVLSRPGVIAQVAMTSRGAIRLRKETRTSRGVEVEDEAVKFALPTQGTSWVTMSVEVTDLAPSDLKVTVEHQIETSGFRSLLSHLVVKEHNVTTLRVIRTS